jgi:hypothetical protein
MIRGRPARGLDRAMENGFPIMIMLQAEEERP